MGGKEANALNAAATVAASGSRPVDYLSAAEIIAHLPLQQPAESEARLSALLGDILQNPPSVDELYSLLEYARPSLHFVRATAVRHYLDHAPHLESEAEAHFQRGLQLWQRVVEAYQLCLAKAPGDEAHTTLLLHRCLMHTGMQILELYRAKRQVPAALWLQLHQLYADAETRGLAKRPLDADASEESRTPHIQALYVAQLLLEVAQPYSRSLSDLKLIWQWADRWAHHARLVRPRISTEQIAFVVELNASRPLHPRPGGEQGPEVRGLHTSELIKILREELADLEQSDAPERLHLSAANHASQRRLLSQLINTWSLDSLPRRFKRFPARETIVLASTFHGIHSVLEHQNGEGMPSDVSTETWRVIDHNPGGFRLGRDEEGVRIENGQLVALCPHDGGEYLLAQVQWLMREQSGQLLAGFAALPGLPRSIAISSDERFKGQMARLIRAFLLPAVAAMQSGASIVIPPGFFEAGKTFETEQGKLRLCALLQRGADFDRASYERF